MSKFEILCVTMHQTDFSKILQMNIHSDVVFANQCDRTAYEELEFDGHTAKMISTQTRGVGKNRNLALIYASAEICLFADDDVRYVDGMEDIVVSEFGDHPDADIIIFHLESDDPARPQKKYSKTRKCPQWERMPWGAIRIAFRTNTIKKTNLWFTTLFGGGCAFPSGEDSLFLLSAKRSGLTFYVSDKTIGTVSVANSSWYTGADEKFYFGKGAFYEAAHRRTFWLWTLYFTLRTKKKSQITTKQMLSWMKKGRIGYRQFKTFDDFKTPNA